MKRKPPFVMCAVSYAAVLAVSACSSAGGTAQPVPKPSDPTAQSGSNLPRHGAPVVTDPLKVDSLKSDTCNAMTQEQAESFAGTLTGTKVERDGESAYCVWNYSGGRYPYGSIRGGLDMSNDDGLTRYFSQKNSGGWKVQKIDAIAGYPAVIHDVGLQSIGGCVIAVGVQNDLVYKASTQLGSEHPSRDKPCEIARNLATLAVQNLKEAQ